jgi:hypothetical protein
VLGRRPLPRPVHAPWPTTSAQPWTPRDRSSTAEPAVPDRGWGSGQALGAFNLPALPRSSCSRYEAVMTPSRCVPALPFVATATSGLRAHPRHHRGDLQCGVVRVGDRRSSRRAGQALADATPGQRLAKPVGALLVDHRRSVGSSKTQAGTSTVTIWGADSIAPSARRARPARAARAACARPSAGPHPEHRRRRSPTRAPPPGHCADRRLLVFFCPASYRSRPRTRSWNGNLRVVLDGTAQPLGRISCLLYGHQVSQE